MYQPEYYTERELFISRVRRQIDEMGIDNSVVAEFMEEVIGFYEQIVDMVRLFDETYDYEERARLGRDIDKASQLLAESLNRAIALCKEEKANAK